MQLRPMRRRHACGYDSMALAVPRRFFRDGGSWGETYGQFFLSWYSQQLLDHADAVLGIARHTFARQHVDMHATLPAIYWWHHTESHAVRSAPLTCKTNQGAHGSKRALKRTRNAPACRWRCLGADWFSTNWRYVQEAWHVR